MTKQFDFYKCKKCGNVIEVIEGHDGIVSCCGEPMSLCAENTSDGAKEKHVPVIEQTAEGYVVKVGSVPHPMTAEHYIEFIELWVDGNRYVKYLKPGDVAEYEFYVKPGKQVHAREYCNLHGLWKADR
ncbi:MAG: desulfoferrodoxin [Spirochaetaceae bacterium]|nr:desulfoferrodoxin [Spirochaetaceae bacterium]